MQSLTSVCKLIKNPSSVPNMYFATGLSQMIIRLYCDICTRKHIKLRVVFNIWERKLVFTHFSLIQVCFLCLKNKHVRLAEMSQTEVLQCRSGVTTPPWWCHIFNTTSLEWQGNDVLRFSASEAVKPPLILRDSFIVFAHNIKQQFISRCDRAKSGSTERFVIHYLLYTEFWHLCSFRGINPYHHFFKVQY